MNHKASKLEITQKLDELLSAIEQLLNNENDTGFYAELSKHKLIQLYDSLSSYNSRRNATDIKEETCASIQNEAIIHEHVKPIEESSPIPENTYTSDNMPITTETESILDVGALEQVQENVFVESAEEKTEVSSAPIQNEIVETPKVIVSEPEFEEIKQPQEKSKKQTPQSDNQAQILSDKYNKENTSVFEKYSSKKEDTSIGSQLQATPLLDLKKSIGINDRFSYINELFSGNKDNYDKFIDSIIQAANAENVITYLNQTSSENNWQSKPSFAKFSEMIKRYSLSK